MNLSNEQKNAIDVMKAWFDSGSVTPFVLEGGAGTGKTTIVKELVRSLGLSNMEILACTYTHSALNRLKSSFGQNGNYLTVAQTLKRPLLSLKVTIDDDIANIPVMGLEDFEIEDLVNKQFEAFNLEKVQINDETDFEILSEELTSKNNQKINMKYETVFLPKGSVKLSEDDFDKDYIRCVICDESSMISDEDAQAIVGQGIPVIFIGDGGQLSAVNGSNNRYIYNQSWENRIELKLNFRNDKEILALANEVRYCEEKQMKLKKLLQKYNNSNSIAWFDGALEFPEMFKKKAKFIALKNTTVHALNEAGRSIFKCKSDFFEENEPMTFLTNSYGKDKLITNGLFAEFCRVVPNSEIKEINEEIANLARKAQVKLCEVLMEVIVDDEIKIVKKRIWISSYRIMEHTMHQDDYLNTPLGRKLNSSFNILEKTLKSCIDKSWFDDDRVHIATFAYAITIHKAQGGEWDEVAFINDNFNVKENSRKIYTAISRAKKHITIFNF